MEFDNVTAAAIEGVEPTEVVEPFVEQNPIPYPDWIIRILQCLAWSGEVKTHIHSSNSMLCSILV